ncbi:hypothetical protein ACWGOE_04215 [Leucobacter chromiiresistens]
MTNQKTDGSSLLSVAQCPEERDQPHSQASNGEHASNDREDRIHGDMVTGTASVSAISDPAEEHHDAEERQAESEDHAATVTGGTRELIDRLRDKAAWYGQTDGGPLMREAADALEASEQENDDLSSRLGEFLCEVTGGLLSYPTYPVSTMVQHTDEYYEWRAKEDHDDWCDKEDALAAPVEVDEAKLSEALHSAMRDNAMLFDNGTEEWIAESDPVECLPELAHSLAERREEWLRGNGR